MRAPLHCKALVAPCKQYQQSVLRLSVDLDLPLLELSLHRAPCRGFIAMPYFGAPATLLPFAYIHLLFLAGGPATEGSAIELSEAWL